MSAPRRGTPEERLGWLATHEAGHAVLAWRCPVVDAVTDMIIEPAEGGDALWQGRVLHGWTKAPPEERLAWDIVIALGGLAAEMLCYAEVRTRLLRDLDEALRAARTFSARGMSWPLGDATAPGRLPFTVSCSDGEAEVLGRAWATACAMLAERREPHARLAWRLAERRRLNEHDLAGILGPRRGA